MERCGFFDAYLVGGEYDRVYLAESFAAYFASFIGNGVYAKHSNQLQVVQQSTPAMSIQVLGGQGWIDGYWYENTDSMSIPIEVADGVLNRIDSIVLRLGFSERDMWLAIKKGTPANVPSPPALTRNADYYELQLATISIPASSINITQAQITDTRMNQEVCGWVTGVVEQLDTTTLFNQFETYFAEFKEFYEEEYDTWTDEQKAAYISWITNQENDFTGWTDEQKAEYDEWYATHILLWQTEFDTWFENVKGQLSEDAAGAIQVELDEQEARLSNIEKMLISGKAFAPAEISSGELLATSDNEVIMFEWPIGCQC